MGWPGIDYEELEELLGPEKSNDLKEVRNAALGHLQTASDTLEALYTRSAYVAVADAMREIDMAYSLIRGVKGQ